MFARKLPPLGESKTILFNSAVSQVTLPRDVSTALRLLNMTDEKKCHSARFIFCVIPIFLFTVIPSEAEESRGNEPLNKFFACIISTKKRADKSFKQSFLKKDRKVGLKHTLGRQNYIKTHFLYKKRQDGRYLR